MRRNVRHLSHMIMSSCNVRHLRHIQKFFRAAPGDKTIFMSLLFDKYGTATFSQKHWR